MIEPPLPSLSFVGAGSLGQVFAALIAASGQPVTLLATPPTAARLREAGCIRLRGAVDLEIPAAPSPAPAGRVTVTGLGATYLGELGGGTSPRVTAAADILRQAGIPVTEAADIRSALWSKTCNAAGVFGVSVLTRTSAPRMFRDPDLIRAYLSLVRETAAIAAAHGVALGDYASFPIRTFLA